METRVLEPPLNRTKPKAASSILDKTAFGSDHIKNKKEENMLLSLVGSVVPVWF